MIVAQNGSLHNAQVLGVEVKTDKIETATVVFAQQRLNRIAHVVSEKHLARVFLQHEARAYPVPIIIGVFQLVALRTAQEARVGFGQQCRVADRLVTLLFFKDLLVATHHLMFAVTRHFVERNLVATVVFSDVDDGCYDGQSLLVEAFHHLQLLNEQKITVIATIFLQFLILEHVDESQF